MKWRFWTRPEPITLDDCQTIDPLLSLYADKMTSAEEAERVEAHLPGCATCREALAWMQATQRALAARPIVSPPADLRARIAGAIAASSAAPIPISLPVRRAFVLRPAYAAAASLTALGVVISYSLLHHPSQVIVRSVKHPSQVAALPRVNPAAPVTIPADQAGVKPHTIYHPARRSKPASFNPGLVAVKPVDDSLPVKAKGKTPVEAGSVTRLATTSFPALSPVKTHLTLPHKPLPSKPNPALMAKANAPTLAVETHKALAPKPEDRKPETVVAAVPHTSTEAVPVNVGPASIKPDPLLTVTVATAHESHFQTADLLGPVKARLGQMQAFTHNSISREAASGATYAMRTLDSDRTPGVDLVHGPTH